MRDFRFVYFDSQYTFKKRSLVGFTAHNRSTRFETRLVSVSHVIIHALSGVIAFGLQQFITSWER